MTSLRTILSPVQTFGPNYFHECEKLTSILNELFGCEIVEHVCLYGLDQINQALGDVDPTRTFGQLYGLHCGKKVSAQLRNSRELLERAQMQVQEDMEQLELPIQCEIATKVFLAGLHYWRFVEQTVLPESPIDRLVLHSAPVADDTAGGINVQLTRKPYTVPLGLDRNRPNIFIVLRF